LFFCLFISLTHFLILLWLFCLYVKLLCLCLLSSVIVYAFCLSESSLPLLRAGKLFSVSTTFYSCLCIGVYLQILPNSLYMSIFSLSSILKRLSVKFLSFCSHIICSCVFANLLSFLYSEKTLSKFLVDVTFYRISDSSKYTRLHSNQFGESGYAVINTFTEFAEPLV